MAKAFDLKFSPMILYQKSFKNIKFSSKTEEIEKNPLSRERCIDRMSRKHDTGTVKKRILKENQNQPWYRVQKLLYLSYKPEKAL